MNFFKRANSVDSKREFTLEQQRALIEKALEDNSRLIDQLVKLSGEEPKVSSQNSGRSIQKPCTSKQALEDGEISDSTNTVVDSNERINSPTLKRWTNGKSKAALELNKGELSFGFEKTSTRASSPKDDSDEEELDRHVIHSKRERDQEDRKNYQKPNKLDTSQLNHNSGIKSFQSKDFINHEKVRINGKLFKVTPITDEDDMNQSSRIKSITVRNRETLLDDTLNTNLFHQRPAINQASGKPDLQTAGPVQYSRGNEKSLTFFT